MKPLFFAFLLCAGVQALAALAACGVTADKSIEAK